MIWRSRLYIRGKSGNFTPVDNCIIDGSKVSIHRQPRQIWENILVFAGFPLNIKRLGEEERDGSAQANLRLKINATASSEIKVDALDWT